MNKICGFSMICTKYKRIPHFGWKPSSPPNSHWQCHILTDFVEKRWVPSLCLPEREILNNCKSCSTLTGEGRGGGQQIIKVHLMSCCWGIFWSVERSILGDSLWTCFSLTQYAQSGWTALHHAAAGGHAECVKALGEAGERALVDLRTWEVLFFSLKAG